MINKIALITGVSSGIGMAVCQKLSQNNYQVYGISRHRIKLPGGGKTLICDLADINNINDLIKNIKSVTDYLDIIINIAGVWHGENSVYSDTDFNRFSQSVVLDTINVGIVAPMILVHGLLDLIPKYGKIINLSGTFENGGKGWLPYYVSKRAIEDFTVGLAQDLINKNIQVNCISPSDVATPAYQKFFPQYVAEALKPESVAEKIYKLCLDNKTTGKIFVVKKGQLITESFHC